MSEPTVIRAGDSVAWTETLTAFPASSGWVLKYRMLWVAGAAVDISTVGSGNDHSVSLTPADTASWKAGAATLVKWIEQGPSVRATLDQIKVTIQPDLTTAGTFDGRSANAVALADAKGALAGYLAGGKAHVAEYDIAGRRMKFRDADQILALIAHYEREVAKETALAAALQGVVPGRIYYRG